MSDIFGCTKATPCWQDIEKGLELQKHPNDDLFGITLKTADGFCCEYSKNLESESTTGLCANRLKARGHYKNACVPVSNNLYCVALNGNIYNFQELKHWCNAPFDVNTEEELLLALLCITDMSDKFAMMQKLQTLIKGAPGFAFINNREDAIYAVCGTKPFFVGFGENSGYISTQANALSPFCKKITVTELGDIIKITKNKITILDAKLKKAKRKIISVPKSTFYRTKTNLGDEVYNIPLAVKEINKQYIKTTKSDLKLDTLKVNKRGIEKIKRIVIIADCEGYSAAVSAKHNFETLCDIPTTAVLSGEMRYSNFAIDKSVLIIALSYRGEDDDTVVCVKKAENHGAKVIGVTSNPYSVLSLCCDASLCPTTDFNLAGISVRPYITQYLSLSYLALEMSRRLGIIDNLRLCVTVKMAELLPGKITSAIKQSSNLNAIAEEICNSDNFYITATGSDYGTAIEANHIINKICKINSYCMPCCALAESGIEFKEKTVIAIICRKENLHHIMHRLLRCEALGASITVITTESIAEEIKDFKQIVAFNDSTGIFNGLPILSGVFGASVNAAEHKHKNVEKREKGA